MNKLNIIKQKKETGFFQYAIERIEGLFFKKDKELDNPQVNIKKTISSIKSLNLPTKIERELLSQLYIDLENEDLKYKNN